MQGSVFPFLLEMTSLADIDFEDFLSRNSLAPERVRIITGARYSRQISNLFARRVRNIPVELIPAVTNSVLSHERICRREVQPQETLVIGIGGGGVLDIAKFHASEIHQPYLAVPTVISNDGVASPIAILADESGTMRSYSTAPPIGILIDQNILSQAPAWALRNGLGDVLSNHSAVMDWDLAIKHGQAEPNALARIMSRSAVQSILPATPCLRDGGFLDCYIDAIVLSGLAMYISGNSRPCSGAEHLIAHAITSDRHTHFGHGFLVGSIAPFVVWLHERGDRTLLPIADAVGLEPDFFKLVRGRRSFASLMDEARTIRGPRFTILNQLSTTQLEAEYRAYLHTLRSRNDRPSTGFSAASLAIQ